MSVPKGKRTESRYEAYHHFYRLRTELTRLILEDFGFSENKYKAKMDKYYESHKNAENIDDIMERWTSRNESFKRWFIDEEGRAIINLLRAIEREASIASSIYPSNNLARLFEFYMRR